jgi:hypothetical protein
VPEDGGICRVAGRGGGGGGGGGGDDGSYYDLPHVRRAAARPVRRIRHSEVVLVDAPLGDGQSKRMIMMCRRTHFFAKSFLIGTVRKVYSRTHSSIFFKYWHGNLSLSFLVM